MHFILRLKNLSKLLKTSQIERIIFCKFFSKNPAWLRGFSKVKKIFFSKNIL